jgi:hypothetical protein
MKIKLLADFRGKKKGDEIEWPDAMAEKLIESGLAEKPSSKPKRETTSLKSWEKR